MDASVKELILKARQANPRAEPEAICSALAALGFTVQPYAVKYLLECDKKAKLSDLIRAERSMVPTPGPKAIHAALKARGRKVTIRYIKLVLWRDKQPKKAKKPRRSPKDWPQDDSISQAIRALLYEDATMPTATIQHRLKEQKKDASSNLIKVVRHQWRNRSGDYYGSDGKVRSRRERWKLDFMRDLQSGSEPMPTGGMAYSEFNEILDEARRELGLEPRRTSESKSDAENDAEV